MTARRLFICCSIAAAALLAGTALQAQDKPSPDCALHVASGPAGKVYELMVRDLQAVCGASVPLCSVPSSGGLQNLSMLSANEAELGLVQLDTLQEMRNGDDNLKSLQAVMPLHTNLLHVLTLAAGSRVDVATVPGLGTALPMSGRTVQIRRFSELKGMNVAVVGSAQLMGQTLERQLRYGMKFEVAESDDEAVNLLRAGKVQAIFTLGGWPLPAITKHKTKSGLVLADYDLTPQAPYLAVKRNYQNLEAFNLNFLGVPNLLVTRPFKPAGAMGTRVAALQACIRQHLDDLQEGRYQPVWKEIKEPMASLGVPVFNGASAKPGTVR